MQQHSSFDYTGRNQQICTPQKVFNRFPQSVRGIPGNNVEEN